MNYLSVPIVKGKQGQTQNTHKADQAKHLIFLLCWKYKMGTELNTWHGLERPKVLQACLSTGMSMPFTGNYSHTSLLQSEALRRWMGLLSLSGPELSVSHACAAAVIKLLETNKKVGGISGISQVSKSKTPISSSAAVCKKTLQGYTSFLNATRTLLKIFPSASKKGSQKVWMQSE